MSVSLRRLSGLSVWGETIWSWQKRDNWVCIMDLCGSEPLWWNTEVTLGCVLYRSEEAAAAAAGKQHEDKQMTSSGEKTFFTADVFLHVIAETTQVCLIINSDDAPLRGAVVSWACCWVDRLTGSGRTGTLDGTGPSQAEALPALTAQNVCREKSSVVLFYIKHVKGSQRRWKYFSVTIFFFFLWRWKAAFLRQLSQQSILFFFPDSQIISFQFHVV